MDMFEDLFDESSALADVDTGTGKRLSGFVRDLRQVEDEIAAHEEAVKKLKQQRQKLSMELIPGLMDEMGIERLDVDGVTVSRKLLVSASIPEERREDAFGWLRENGLDDILKNDVVLSFGKGEDNVAGDVVGLLRDRGFDPQTKTHIHPMTLKSFIRDRVEAGKPIDLDMFGAFVANVAEIKRKA